MDRAKLAPASALRGSVAMAIPLVVGALTGQILVGVTVAIGALSSGFASLQGTYRSRVSLVVAATGALALSAFVGATVGHLEGPDIAVSALWGLTAGMLVTFGAPGLLVGLQAVVGLVVFSQFHFTTGQAAVDGAWVLAGGGLQALLVTVLWPLQRFPAERRALADVYHHLAGYARSLLTSSTGLADPASLQAARTALADPQPFGLRAERTAYQAVLDEGERIRWELAVLGEGCLRLAEGGDGALRGELTAMIAAVADVLDGVAESLRTARTPTGLGDHGDLIVSTADQLRAIAEDTSSTEQWWRRATLGEVSRSCQALTGQLRAVVRLAAVAAGTAPPEVQAEAFTSLPGARSRPWAGRLAATRGALEQLRANLSFSSPTGRHAVRLAVGLAAAVALSHLFKAGHGYWLPLTVVIVLRADFTTTFTRGVARTVGTVTGAGLVTLLIAGVRPGHAGLIALTLAFYWVAATLLLANYTVYSVFIASLVVTLLAFTGEPAPTLAADRALYTVVGAALALFLYTIWPTWERSVVAENLASLLDADRRYGDAVLAAWVEPGPTDDAALHRTRMAARRARSNVEESVNRWLSEPVRSGRFDPDVVRGVLAALRRYVRGILALHAALPAPAAPPPEIAVLRQQVDEALAAVSAVLRDGQRESVGSLPTLRSAQLELVDRLQAAGRGVGAWSDGRAAVLAGEIDVVVDAVNSLCHLVGLDKVQPR